MRTRKVLAVMLMLVLLLGMIPAATMEGLEDEILSETVDLPVPEEELALGGAPEDVGAEERAVSPWVDDTWNVRGTTLIGYSGDPDMVIPAYITEIGSGAFRRDGVESVRCEAGSQLTTIGNQAFYGNTDLKSVVLPDSVTTLGDEVFYLSFLEEITLSKSLTEIPVRTFSHADITSIVIPEGVTRIGEEAFAECTDLKSIVLPSTLTEIGDSAFVNCSALTSVVLPDGLTSLGAAAFSGCTALASVNIPKKLTTIDASAFSGCGMTSLSVPGTVTTVGDYAFSDCKNLVSAILPASVATLGRGVFYRCAALEGVTLPKGITAIPENTFRESGLKSYTVPQSVTTIGTSAFRGCARLTSIGIPDGVTDIGESAFADCSALRQVTLPKSITKINTQAFSKCAALESIEVPDGVWGIGNQAFEYCTSLKTVVLPESVREISYLAFRGCKSLETVVIPGKDVSFKFYGSASVTPFNTCGDQLVILCYYGSSVEKYCKENGIAYGYIIPPEPTAIALFEEGSNSILFPRDLEVGDKLILEAIVLPEVIEAKLTWKSSDTKVATVKDGVVTAVGPGTAIITATTTNGLSDDMTVNVAGNGAEDPKPTARPTVTPTAAPTAKPVSLAKAEVTLKTTSYTYNGKARKPAVTSVKLNGKTLKQGTDYKVTYADNKKVGKATVTVKGINKYTGSVKKTFKIKPNKVSGLKLKAGAKKLTVSWTKGKGGITGYEVQYATDSKFTKAKTVKITKAATVKKTITKLKAKKTYYVRIRAYKKVSSKTNYYSAWSDPIKKKTK